MFTPLTIGALAGAAGLSAIALSDAVTFALTGQRTPFSDDFGVNPAFVVGGLVHALAYVLFAAVVISRRAEIDGGSRLRRVVRRVLTAALLLLAVGMSVHTALSVATGEVNDNAVFGAVAGIALLLMVLGSITLGISLLRRPDMHLPARTLTAVLPALGLTVLLAALGSAWAHPAYAETLVSFGLAFIGLTPRADDVTARAADPLVGTAAA